MWSSPLSILKAVANVVARGVVIPAIQGSQPRSVEMHRDGGPAAGVGNAVDTPGVGRHGRDTIATAPGPPPDRPQMGAVGLRFVVKPLIALLQQRPGHA